MGWHEVENGSSIGTIGSENGIIIRDEEYESYCRITLEKGGHTPYGITCGIYGLMAHTAFASNEQDALAMYNAMKAELQQFINADDDTDIDNWCDQFFHKW